MVWKEAVDNAGWSKRDAHTSVVFQNRIWIMGGIKDGDKNLSYSEHIHESDVWISKNGKDWELITDNAPWGKTTPTFPVELTVAIICCTKA